MSSQGPLPRRCVLVFARAPGHEARRKRLSCARPLFEASLRRIAALAAKSPELDFVVAGDRPAGRLGRCARWIAQRGASFGERLANAFADVRALGYDEVVAIPGDVPGLQHGHLERAFARLAAHAVVCGAAPDGGVWLLGLRGPPDPALAGLPWRTAGLREALVRATGAVQLGPLLADLDRRADLLPLLATPALAREVRRALLAVLAALARPRARRLLQTPSRRVASSPQRSRAPPRHAA